MSSTLIPPPLTSRSRCPSPVVPGAWPQSTTTPTHLRHERSSTYPPSSRPGPAVPSAPVHLDHVTSFQQRLSLSLSKPRGSTGSGLHTDTSGAFGGVFVPSHSIPDSTISKNDSDLTTFVLHDTSHSFLQSADTSVTTAYTSESVSCRISTPSEHVSETGPEHSFVSHLDDVNEERIYSHKLLPVTPMRLPQTINDDSVSSQMLSSPVEPGSDTRALHPERTGITVPLETAPAGPSTPGSPRSAASASVPTSPIIFASPMCSKIGRSALRPRLVLQETSDGASFFASSREHSSLGVVGRNDLSASPSETLMEDGSDRMNMLTTLSLLDTPHSTGGLENEADVLDGSWMQSNSSQSLLSPISMNSTSLQLEGDGQEAGLTASSPLPALPLSPLTLSSPTVTVPFPSPISELSSLHASFAAGLGGFDEDPEPTSAIEYAEAIMSFAWRSGSVYRAMDVGETIGLNLIATENDVSIEEPRVVPPIEYLSKGTSTRKSVIEKILRFGGKMKRLWRSSEKRWKDLAVVRDLGRRSTGLTVNMNVNTNVDTSAPTQSRISTDASSPRLRRNTQDPNARLRLRKPRPSLNEHAYSTALLDHVPSPEGSGSPPSPHNDSAITQDIKGKGKASVSERPTDSEHQRMTSPVSLQKRSRLSVISTTTNTGHSADTQPTFKPRPLSSIVAVNRHIPVTKSPRRTYCGPVNVAIEGLNPNVPAVQTNAGVERPQGEGPPGLPSATTSMVGNAELQVPGISDSHINTPQNTSRRFSLSALSNFTIWKDISASGRRKRGSWISARTRT